MQVSKEEIENKISKVKESLFLINMVDRWTPQDAEDYKELTKELKQLEETLLKIKEGE